MLKKQYKKDICRIFGVAYSTLKNWKEGKNLIPLNIINKIIEMKEPKYSWNLFEGKTIEYKTKSGENNSVRNPVLPIMDSKELREVVLHLMADGCVEKYAAYYNYDICAKKEFIKELRYSFGETDYKLYEDHVHFSMAIPHILRHYFRVDFHGNKCRVPKEFFNGTKEQLNAILRAMLIDEGTIDGSNARIDSNNVDFLNDVRNIAVKLGYKCGRIWKSAGPIFRFNILSKSISKFYNEIKPIPIKNKENLLKLAFETQKKMWKYFIPGTIKIRIINYLLSKPTSSVELSHLLGIQRGTLNKHWKWLLKEDLVKCIGKEKYCFIYSIKDKGKATKFLKNPKNFLNDRKFNEYGLTQLKVIEFLQKKSSKLKSIRILLGNSKPATLKTLNSLIKKRYIHKKEKIYSLTEKGRYLLNLNRKIVRFVLYSNIKNLNEIKKIDLNYVGLI